MSNQNLKGDAHGVIVIEAGDSSFVCTDLQMQIAMNEIPTAVVTVGCGNYIKTPGKKQNPEDLLSKVLSKQSAAYTEMVDCDIYEQSATGSQKKIFTGCIVTGTPIYKAGMPTLRAIRFYCMNRACKLMCRPMSEFVQLEGNILINYIGTKTQFEPALALSQASAFKAGHVGAEYIFYEIAGSIRQGKLHERVSKIVDAIVSAGSYCDKVKNFTAIDNHVGDYITSEHGLNAGVLGDTTMDSFNIELCKQLFELLLHGSVWESIKSLVTSENFMLQLTPQFGDDFKIKLEPSSAWVKQDPIKLTDAHVISIESKYNPIACINTPDAFVVNYAPAVSMLQNEQVKDYIGANGVFTINPELDTYLKNKFQSANPDPGALGTKLLRAKTYNAPKWLLPAFADKAAQPGTPQSVADHDRKESSKDDDPPPMPVINKNEANLLANKIAQAIFTLIYGAQDSAVLTLMPNLRFCNDSEIKLEESIGKPVEVKITGADTISIRGTLTRIDYSYSATESSQIGYSIGLTRVRPLDKDDVSVECPLYVKM
jgi:hypothetical protein